MIYSKSIFSSHHLQNFYQCFSHCDGGPILLDLLGMVYDYQSTQCPLQRCSPPSVAGSSFKPPTACRLRLPCRSPWVSKCWQMRCQR